MKVHQLHARNISPQAQELIDFDIDSIRQIVAAGHQPLPAIWLANPDQYELNGRLLRDSTSPRLLAYSPERSALYVTDGCNSCAHHVDFSHNNLSAFSAQSEIRLDLLERMAEIIRASGH